MFRAMYGRSKKMEVNNILSLLIKKRDSVFWAEQGFPKREPDHTKSKIKLIVNQWLVLWVRVMSKLLLQMFLKGC
jgi:hypothetical protein